MEKVETALLRKRLRYRELRKPDGNYYRKLRFVSVTTEKIKGVTEADLML